MVRQYELVSSISTTTSQQGPASPCEHPEALWSPLKDRICCRRHSQGPCIFFTGWNWLQTSFRATEFGLLVISSTTASAAARKSTWTPIYELWLPKLTINPVYTYCGGPWKDLSKLQAQPKLGNLLQYCGLWDSRVHCMIWVKKTARHLSHREMTLTKGTDSTLGKNHWTGLFLTPTLPYIHYYQ